MCKTISINPDLTWVGALDPNLRIFDIIMETKFGTTYNSYVLKGTDGVAIFETVKEKFFDEHLEKIKSVLESGKSARTIELNDDEKELVKDVYLLTAKPILYIANVSEEQLQDAENDKYVNQVKEYAKKYGIKN